MHIPPYTKQLSGEEPPQLRVLIVGPPKSGKKTSAATFPNPLFVDFDNGLQDKSLREKNYPVLPFHNIEWLKETYPKCSLFTAKGSIIKPASAFVEFLKSNDIELMTIEQTLIINSLSTLADAVMKELETEHAGEIAKNAFAYWAYFADWFREFCIRLTQLKCNVVLTAHEDEIRDKDSGRVLSFKFKLTGKEFSPRLPQYFTHVFRMTKISKDTGGNVMDKLSLTSSDAYLWQVKSSDEFAAYSRTSGDKKFVPANYKYFLT